MEGWVLALELAGIFGYILYLIVENSKLRANIKKLDKQLEDYKEELGVLTKTK